MKIFGLYVTREDNLARAIEAEQAAAFWADTHSKLGERFDLLQEETDLATAALSRCIFELRELNKLAESVEVSA